MLCKGTGIDNIIVAVNKMGYGCMYVKGYGFLSLTKSMGKKPSSKYGWKIPNNTNKSATNALKTALKQVLKKAAKTTGGLKGNKITDKIKSAVSQKTSS